MNTNPEDDSIPRESLQTPPPALPQHQGGAPPPQPIYVVKSEQVSVPVAGFLNYLWPGAGYFVIGQTTKGAVFCAVTLCSFCLLVMSCGFGVVVHLPYVIAAIVDVVLLGQRLNRNEKITEWQFF